MKKTLLLMIVLLLAGSVFSQQNKVSERFRNQKAKHFFNDIGIEPVGLKAALFPATFTSQLVSEGPNAVSILDLGQSGNAFGTSGGARTYLWAQPDISSVSLVHRMAAGGVYGNSRLAFDASLDGGATWYTNVQVYDPLGPGTTYPLAAGRYPQGGIYNPSGNTNPANGVFHYFAPTLDASNGDSWGGYGYGVRKLDTLAPAIQHNTTSHDGYLQNVPDAMTIIPSGKTMIAEAVVTGGIATNYLDTMIFSLGQYNAASGDFDYTQELFYLPSDKYIADTKVAFSPDGNTGYLSVLSHHDFAFEPDSAFYPMVYKTTNGGASWSAPMYVKLWGPDGLAGIKNYLTDSMIGEFFEPPIPTRDEIPYTTAWEHDLVVDANGNPHIAVVVGISAGEWNIYTTRNYIAIFDIYSNNGGLDWEARWLDSLKTFKVEYAGANPSTEYHRPQAGRSLNGSALFFSWLDTEDPGATDNTAPNIYCQAHNIMNGVSTETKNVTKFTLAYSQAYMAAASHYVFEDAADYAIPFVYQDMNVTNNADPVQFKYIHGFKIPKTELMGLPGVSSPVSRVSQNFPNPCSEASSIIVQLEKPEKVYLTVHDFLGRQLSPRSMVSCGSGESVLHLDVSSYPAGIYLVSILIGTENHTIRMIVQ